jgi:hypothetical protein
MSDLGYAIAFVGREENRSQPKQDPPLIDDKISWIEFEQVDGMWAFLSYRHRLRDATHFESREQALTAIREAHENPRHMKYRAFEHASSYIIPIQPPISDREFYGF